MTTTTTAITEWPLRGGDFTESMFTHYVRRHPDWKAQGEKRFAVGVQPLGYFDTAREVLLFDHHDILPVILMPLKWNSWIILHNKQYVGIVQVLQNFKASNDDIVIRVCEILWQEFLRQSRLNSHITGPLHAFLVYLVVHGFPDIKSLPRWINVGRWYTWWLDHAMAASSTSSPSSLSVTADEAKTSTSPSTSTSITSTSPLSNPLLGDVVDKEAHKSGSVTMDFLTFPGDASSSELLPT